jgi:CDGSH-type Zn-finger protein
MSEDKVIITPLPHGPNQVTGGVIVKDADGNVIKEAETVYLCRCGFSADKPFCDGAHKRNNWQS